MNELSEKDLKKEFRVRVATKILNSKGSTAIKNYFISKVLKEKVKNHFGISYTFTSQELSASFISNVIIGKFIKKYDKRFEKHVTTVSGDTRIENKVFIIPLDKGTYLYVASGDFILNPESQFYKGIRLNSYDLHLYIFGKKMRKYTRELETLIQKEKVNTGLGIYYVDSSSMRYAGYRNGSDEEASAPSESMNVTFTELSPRSMDTLFFSNNEKETICKYIDSFLSLESFYRDKQLLYKTGILLYGEPGTGKSSLVKAMATKYNRSIVNINVNNLEYIDLVSLTKSINADNLKYFVLLEDIDTLFLNRKGGESDDKESRKVINKLLQFLDSNTSPNNVIFVATTNHIDRLDDALLRDGRFDLKVNIAPLEVNEVVKFGQSFNLTSDQINDVVHQLRKDTPERTTFNQSKVQNYLISKLENRSVENIKEKYGEMNE